MINLSSIIAGFVASFLDSLKTKNVRLFAIIGAVLIAAEAAIVSGALPFAAQIPAVVVETLVAIVATLGLARSYNLATAVPAPSETVGSWIDRQLSVLIQKFKQGSLVGYTVVQSVLAGFKFFLVSDTSLTWSVALINAILTGIMWFAAPSTTPILAAQGKLPSGDQASPAQPQASSEKWKK